MMTKSAPDVSARAKLRLGQDQEKNKAVLDSVVKALNVQLQDPFALLVAKQYALELLRLSNGTNEFRRVAKVRTAADTSMDVSLVARFRSAKRAALGASGGSRIVFRT